MKRQEVIFLKGFKGETLENVIDYWAMMNNKKIEGLTVTDNLHIKRCVDEIKDELNIKDLKK